MMQLDKTGASRLIRSDPQMRPVYEDFTQPICQDGTWAYLDEDAGPSSIECLYLR
jgi:hypothetical protein